MFQRCNLLLIFMIMVFHANAFDFSYKALGKDTIVKGITQDESILFNMINDMRRQNKLAAIPLSLDLCTVAHTHIDDLMKWRPQDKGCSLHSWSGSGKWSPCCNSKDPSGIQCMKSKPAEITGYTGNGYELIYWGEENATPADATELWKQVDASADMILCRGKWKGYQWKALGVGIKDGYAVLWLGDKADKITPVQPVVNSAITQVTPKKEEPAAKPPAKKKENAKVEAIAEPPKVVDIETKSKPAASQPGTTFFLVVSSVKTAEAASSELKKIKSKGYNNAVIVEGDAVYRIAIASFDSSKKAAARQNELKNEFPGIWVLKK